MTEQQGKTIEKAAIENYGDMQVVVAIEELSELQKELTKYLRCKPDPYHIAEEIADVEIMVEQMKMKFKPCFDKIADNLVGAIKIKKLERLRENMMTEELKKRKNV